MACYVYWLIHFNLPTRAFNLATRAFSVLTRESELVTRRFKLVTRGFEFVTREIDLATHGFELVSCGFELVTRVILFHPQAVVQGLLENRLTFFDEIETLSIVVQKYFWKKITT